MIYLITFFISLILCLGLMPLVIVLARLANFVDMPHARKVHQKAIPRIGGMAFTVATSITVAVVVYFLPSVREQFAAMQKQVIVLFAAALGVFLVGLIDDAKDISGKLKFLSLILGSLAVCWSGSAIDNLIVGEVFNLDLGHFSWPLTVMWITGVTIGVNILDGLDGLAGGLAAIAAGAIAILAFYIGLPIIGIIMLALLGSLASFLFFNYNPAKVFMGDCGSMFLGFMLGASSIICASKSNSVQILGISAVALGVPIIDIACTMVRRVVIERCSVFHADRGHIHHRLLDLGISHRHVVVILYIVTGITVLLAMFILVTTGTDSLAILLCILLLYLIFFKAIGSYNIRLTIAALRRNNLIKQSTKSYRAHFEEMLLEFRRATTFDQWWKIIADAADRLSFQSLTMEFVNRDGSTRLLQWTRDPDLTLNNLKLKTNNTTSINLPVLDRRDDQMLQMYAEVCIDETLESTGTRLTLFMRLLDEHSVADLPRQAKEMPEGTND